MTISPVVQVPAEHITAVSMLDRQLHHATVVVTEGECSAWGRPEPEEVVTQQPADPAPGWGLLLATSGDLNLAVDRAVTKRS